MLCFDICSLLAFHKFFTGAVKLLEYYHLKVLTPPKRALAGLHFIIAPAFHHFQLSGEFEKLLSHNF